MSEAWRRIDGYPTYEVSSLGRVRNTRSSGRRYEVKLWRNNRYLAVSLYKDGERKTRPVHQLVLEAFRGSRPLGAVGRHLDDDRDNNVLGNLSWGTLSQNTLDSVANGSHDGLKRKGAAHPLARLTETCVERVRDMRLLGCSQQMIADWFSVARTTIQGIDNGTRWSHL
jgi:hypothetical protein